MRASTELLEKLLNQRITAKTLEKRGKKLLRQSKSGTPCWWCRAWSVRCPAASQTTAHRASKPAAAHQSRRRPQPVGGGGADQNGSQHQSDQREWRQDCFSNSTGFHLVDRVCRRRALVEWPLVLIRKRDRGTPARHPAPLHPQKGRPQRRYRY